MGNVIFLFSIKETFLLLKAIIILYLKNNKSVFGILLNILF